MEGLTSIRLYHLYYIYNTYIVHYISIFNLSFLTPVLLVWMSYLTMYTLPLGIIHILTNQSGPHQGHGLLAGHPRLSHHGLTCLTEDSNPGEVSLSNV